MNKTLNILGMAALLWMSAGAADVGVDTEDVTGRKLARRRVTLMPEFGQAARSTALVNVDEVATLTGADGRAYFSNVVSGTYKLAIQGAPGTVYRLTVPTNEVLITDSSLSRPRSGTVRAPDLSNATATRGHDACNRQKLRRPVSCPRAVIRR